MLDTLVVPLDGSDFSVRAIPAAMAVGRAGKARLRLVGITRAESEAGPLRRRIEEAARRVIVGDAPAAEVIVADDPVTALLAIADEPGTVLCLASHDRPTATAVLMHSVGSALIERASHPLIVVGADPDGPAPVTSNDVVVAVDGVDDPGPVLSAAVNWARWLQAPLRVVTVYEPVPADIRRPDHFTRHHGPPGDPDAYLKDIGRRLEDAGVTPVDLTAIPDATSVPDGLTGHLRERPALLLVVASAKGLHRLGREMPLPVLVLRGSTP